MHIIELLKLKTHKEVVDELLLYTDESYFIHSSSKFTYIIPKGVTTEKPAPMLCVHTDTVSSKKPKEVHRAGDVLTNPEGVLGADDRAGCWIVQELLKEKDQRFIIGIFDEEEIGGIGSSSLISNDYFNKEVITNDSSLVSCFIGLDRRGGDEVAYYGVESDAFTSLIETYLPNYKPALGSFTDASNLASHYNIACCNLSVGYYCEHTAKESLNIKEMEGTLETLRTLNTLAFSEVVFDVEQIEYDYIGKDYYTPPATSRFKAIKCDVCGIPDTLYEGSFGLHICEYCLEEMEDDNEDETWL